jgi:hypothetical protein
MSSLRAWWTRLVGKKALTLLPAEDPDYIAEQKAELARSESESSSSAGSAPKARNGESRQPRQAVSFVFGDTPAIRVARALNPAHFVTTARRGLARSAAALGQLEDLTRAVTRTGR